MSSTTKLAANYQPMQTADEAEEDEDIEFDIPEDAYGAATLAIVRDFQEAYRGNDVAVNLMTGIFSLSVNTLNLVLQFLIVIYLQSYVVMPKVRQVQLLYHEFHATVFNASGHFNQTKWENFGKQQQLCQIAVTNVGFYFISLFLWWASMMKEIRTTWRLFLNIYHMPSCKCGYEMLRIEVPRHDHSMKQLETNITHIIALTMSARAFLYFLVCLPKFLISIMLLWAGCEWLSATSKFEDLIMNAVAMTFVTHIDELLFEVLLPAKYREEVATINFVVPCRRGPPQKVRNAEMWLGFRRSVFYVAILLLGILFYAEVLEDVLPHNVSDLRAHCAKYIENVEPICKQGLSGAFLRGSTTAGSGCYPYR